MIKQRWYNENTSISWSINHPRAAKLYCHGFTAGINGSHVTQHSSDQSTHHVPHEEKPIVWMRAKTHWRKKMKKKAMKLNELSALSPWEGKREMWKIRSYFCILPAVVSSYLSLLISLEPHTQYDFVPITQRHLTTSDDRDDPPF